MRVYRAVLLAFGATNRLELSPSLRLDQKCPQPVLAALPWGLGSRTEGGPNKVIVISRTHPSRRAMGRRKPPPTEPPLWPDWNLMKSFALTSAAIDRSRSSAGSALARSSSCALKNAIQPSPRVVLTIPNAWSGHSAKWPTGGHVCIAPTPRETGSRNVFDPLPAKPSEAKYSATKLIVI